eukprot:CAMPEP_0198302876 /NCGR_PEP_ID=MMETSP1449-20131203/56594_1 /TAXON_ID=420275 /ORGANISM="Attheya septentrionalis, Strain CCMP2084" /LENGTH=346 /DNA_ID=CAMNT_0044005349 /DNA_START=90 /DNA_END=1130 /DNA_ORIENTATION=+
MEFSWVQVGARNNSLILFLIIIVLKCEGAGGFSLYGSISRFRPLLLSFQDGSNFEEVHDIQERNDDIFGSSERAPVKLTVILPSYNEALRIRDTLKEYTLQLDRIWERGNCDILVVNDGSTDDTMQVMQEFSVDRTIPVDCISLERNVGKGAAVARGISEVGRRQSSNEKDEKNGGTMETIILVADADGSGDMECLESMTTLLASILEIEKHGGNWKKPAMVVGYRNSMETSPLRTVTRWGFRTVVQTVIGNRHVRDSQCGFKLMSLSAGLQLYSNLHLVGWTHDVEVLYRAQVRNIPTREHPVEWTDKAGSKLLTPDNNVVSVSATMLWEVIQMRLEYALGRWTV